MNKSKPTRSERPNDRLTRLCAAMTEALDRHPERGDEQCVVFMDSESEGRSGLQLHGYESDAEAVANVLIHLRAIMRANGKDLQVHALGGSPEQQ